MKNRTAVFGQSTLEYLALAAFVLTAVFWMGPYTVRAINSYFRTSGDAAKDSGTEKFEQAQAPDAVKGKACACRIVSEECSPHCKKTEKYQIRNCDPLGCDEEKRCVNTPGTECCDKNYKGCGGISPDATNPVRCRNTERLVEIDCSPVKIDYTCEADPDYCYESCKVEDLSAGSTKEFCEQSLIGFSSMQSITPHYVASQDKCADLDPSKNDDQRCVGICDGSRGFVPISSGLSCGCRECYTLSGNGCFPQSIEYLGFGNGNCASSYTTTIASDSITIDMTSCGGSGESPLARLEFNSCSPLVFSGAEPRQITWTFSADRITVYNSNRAAYTWSGTLNFTYNISSHILSWSGQSSGSQVLAFGAWSNYIINVALGGPSDDHRRIYLRVMITSGTDQYNVKHYFMASSYGEERDYANASISNLKINNLNLN